MERDGKKKLLREKEEGKREGNRKEKERKKKREGNRKKGEEKERKG